VGRQELVKLLYRLGRQGASGMLSIATGAPRDEILVLRRGAVMCADGEVARRALVARLARLAALEQVSIAFEGGVSAYPPGAQSQLYLAGWARAHLEQQLDGSLADMLVRELAGVRLSVRADLAPEPQDEADRRMLLAMAHPRRIDQIWPLARTPRFRLLAFLHFLRAVGALDVEGIAAARAPHTIDPRRRAALHLLGVREDADLDEVKRAYRRLARALHPDLRPELDADDRRALERRFAEVTAAYEMLV
jgi:hypothetical protein